MTRGRAIVAALIMFAPAAAAKPQPPALDAFAKFEDGTIVHKASGFAFASKLDRLDRITRRATASDRVSVRYGSGRDRDRPWIELVIQPADGTIEQEAEEAGKRLMDRYSAKRLPDLRTLPPMAADGHSRWYAARLGKTSVTTGYVLVRRGGWSIKAQATSPESAGVPGVQQLFDAIAAVRWSWMPENHSSGGRMIIGR